MNDKHYLGNICKNLHEYEGTGKSLRYKSDRGCVACRYYRGEMYKKTSKGQQVIKAAQEKYRNSPKGLKKRKARQATEEHKIKMAIAQKKYAKTEKGKATRLRSEKKYRATEKRRISWKKKHYKRKNLKSFNSIKYTSEEVKDRFNFFGNKCLYCGCNESITIDHVVPLMKGGYDAIYNIAPACFSCNSSKQDKDLEIWYKSKPFFSSSQLKYIKGVMPHICSGY